MKKKVEKNCTPATDCKPGTTCEAGMTCENGMACEGGAKSSVCETPYHPPILDYNIAERKLERKLRNLFYYLDPQTMAYLKALRLQGRRVKEQMAAEEAGKMAEAAGREICLRDLVEAMDASVMDRIRDFGRTRSLLSAAWLLGAVQIRDQIREGSLTEGAETKAGDDA